MELYVARQQPRARLVEENEQNRPDRAGRADAIAVIGTDSAARPRAALPPIMSSASQTTNARTKRSVSV